ncbi:hypothetical protein CSE16_01495 [Solibacillus sp. R5-41]|uniref:hypothetical protein n=1 Tax=Solibacillus sp. R5-41 TaxID=2048654 RepID=UPI000C129761|nr:hypothetical protein [Solibacillus sp. R5-41]ATP38793.1 hypothetical protein CSE16_01495 [Solibacillus sp. R5-41]
MPEHVKQALLQQHPALSSQTLINGMTLISLGALNQEVLSSITEFLVEYNLPEFTFGKVTLSDLYAMYYHEVV